MDQNVVNNFVRVTQEHKHVVVKGAGGLRGVQGPAGAGLQISGSVATYADLPWQLTVYDAGKAYFVQADSLLYVWTGERWPAEGDGAEFVGPQGAPGYSPQATVTKVGDTATITITDRDGTTTAQVKDGADASAVNSYSTSQIDAYSANYMNGELAKKVDVSSISLEGQTTTILAKVQNLGANGVDYARFSTDTNGGTANISDAPVPGSCFVCIAYCTRYASSSDYQYNLVCYVYNTTAIPYTATVTPSTTSISWGRVVANDATLTIQKNGTTVNTFTANASSNVTANITVPTYTTLWTNSNVNANFNAQTVQIANLSTYTFIDILVVPYKGGDQTVIHTIRHYYDTTMKKGEISPVFWYNGNRYYGSRIFTVNASSIDFADAYNDLNIVANDWYIPWKIIGYK